MGQVRGVHLEVLDISTDPETKEFRLTTWHESPVQVEQKKFNDSAEAFAHTIQRVLTMTLGEDAKLEFESF